MLGLVELVLVLASLIPSVLLMTPLLRLSLNVASTRVVLLEGHTGAAAAGDRKSVV